MTFVKLTFDLAKPPAIMVFNCTGYSFQTLEILWTEISKVITIDKIFKGYKRLNYQLFLYKTIPTT